MKTTESPFQKATELLQMQTSNSEAGGKWSVQDIY